MAHFIPMSSAVRRVQIPSEQITDPGNPLVDQAQYHGWLLRSITGISIGIPERGPEPLKKFDTMSLVNRVALRNLLTRMIAIKAPISLHWEEATVFAPMQAAQTKTAMDSLLMIGSHYPHNQLLYELIMAYGKAEYISPNQATNGTKALEYALRGRNHTSIRALVELGADTTGIPHQENRSARGKTFPAGDFDYFMEHWVGHGSSVAQTYLSARMNRDIQEQADQAAIALAALREGTHLSPELTHAAETAKPAPSSRRRGI
ncbi:hypothetical protein [Hydrogenophaga sp. 2FB]|uniref:hypothetical protein n=1 Tax=Hydrogenophaga sp. 2FB TaxID=2502187 RepID=UPI0010F708A8|nr:hypothetical protein [Hydrogenophaga sp. 2FB]